MHTAQTSSPEADVPEVVTELKPHRWQLRPARLAHFTVQKWTPYGDMPVAAKKSKNGVKPTEKATRILRPRTSDEPEIAKASIDKLKDPRQDPLYNFILKTIKT
jgi:hypothetical protein